MWHSKRIFAILIVFICTSIFFITTAYSESTGEDDVVGPGLPPSEMMPKWYLHDSMDDDNANHLSMFPDISQYSDCGNYTRHTIMCVWYFDNKNSFIKSETNLSRYLVESGEVGVVKLNISDEISEIIESREDKNQWRPTLGPKQFNATRYVSKTTSGYFLVYARPFLEEREDYFIVYYGTKDGADIGDQKQELKKLIAKSYYFGNSEGGVEDLHMHSDTSKSPNMVPGFELLILIGSFCCAFIFRCHLLRFK
ncbi:hypothetical protein [Methanohalophilus portucalensis]|uniref:Uncharacterized protein n=2 Tax=Methanohalophilus portucalensis TaxID=39664 RepID=A0A1L9C547_9EURY|nr:hypothetical protein [Methanohalophilus portucalensis]ATU08292.1 hypothetical protein BKM01_05620 [Methanohalophilus portucalensis]OJH49613.1 hypothetical protein MPF_0401 [Methanohalophilus portucalensis FDF-1]SMH35115.1 hypothetical protein SAMN06264941_0936 [Methanohalophilus portucalensis FDF-1]